MTNSLEIVCCQITLKIFRIFGLFPPIGRELNPGNVFFLRYMILMVISSLTLIGSCLHLTTSVKDQVYNHLDVDVAIMLSMVAIYMFTWTFFRKYKIASQLYMHLSNFEEYGKPLDFDENTKLFNKLSLSHYIYLESLVLLILILSNVIKTRQCERENLEYGIHEVCGLFTYTWMPFNIEYFPVKEMYLFLQLFGAHYLYMMAGMMAWGVVETVQHIILRLRYVKHLFLEAVSEKDHKMQREKFSLAARYHDTVLSLEDPLNSIYGMFIFNHLCMTPPILGSALFAILHGGSGSSLFICLGWFFGLSMDCFSGQRLQEESIAIATALYNSEWYNCNEYIKRDILFVIMRCRKPMYLKAAGFGIMDYGMFLGVLKASYSYIALLTQTK